MTYIQLYFLLMVWFILLAACSDDATDSSENSSRAITSFTLDEGQVGEAEIIGDLDSSRVIVTVEKGTDLSAMMPTIEISAGATIEPASGEIIDFSAHGNRYTYVVTSESGVEEQWHIEIVFDQGADKDPVVTDFFRRESGWIAGDGANSIPLSDGRVMWLMDDAHIDDYSNGTMSCFFQVNNAVLLQPMDNWDWTQTTTLTGPNSTNYVDSNPEADYFNWISTGVQLQDTVYVFSNSYKFDSDGEIQTAGPPVWSKVKHPEMTVEGYHEHQDFGDIGFGNGFVKEDDGYVYAYGHRTTFIVADVFVARFPQDDPNRSWRFWNGSGWVDEVADAASIGESASPVPFINKVRDKYVMFSTELSVGCNQGTEIYVSVSDSPTGPFSERKVIYEIDDRFHGNIPRFYWVKAHPEYINEEDELLITYDLNNTSGEPNLSGCKAFCEDGRLNPDKYRPKGVRVPLELIDSGL